MILFRDIKLGAFIDWKIKKPLQRRRRVFSTFIKSEATQLNFAQIAMKSINLADTKGVLEIKRIDQLGERSEDEVLLG